MLHKSTFSSLKYHCINLSPLKDLYFTIHHHPFSSRTAKPESKDPIHLPFDANHLVKAFGLSRENAFKISKESKCNIPEKTEALITFFKKHGFTRAQISCAVKRTPGIFNMKLEKSVLPKIQFFKSLGSSNVETAKLLTAGSYLLKNSLEKKIIPSYESLKSLLLSNESTLFAIRRCPPILSMDVENIVLANVETLLKAGARKDKVLHLLKKQPRVFVMYPDKFKACVERVEEMGFDPQTTCFLCGILVMRVTGVQWSKKVEAYKKWGFSEEQVLTCFRKSPWCMGTSVDKIERVLKYFVKDMKFDPVFLTASPQIMALSMEKTIVPRCSVYQVLLSKSLIRKNISLSWLLKRSKKSFLEKFVLCFSQQAPEISKLYSRKLHLT